MDDHHGSWKPMDPNLKDAACNGITEFLTKAIASSKPQDYWLSRFIPTNNSEEPYAGNILHLAVWHGQTDFVKEAMEKLPKEVVRKLLRHQERAGKLHNRTPALVAIQKGDLLNSEILTSGSRAELIQDLVDDQGNSPLFLAVQNGLDNVVMNILNCQGALCARGPNGLTALHVVPGLLPHKCRTFVYEEPLFASFCEAASRPYWSFSFYLDGSSEKRWREVSEKLFDKLREHFTATDTKGFTILHKWVETCSHSDTNTESNLESLLNYFFKNHGAAATKLMLTPDSEVGNNPLHVLAATSTSTSTSTFSEHLAVKIATKLVDLFKKYMASKSSKKRDWPWLMQNKKGDTPLLLAIRNRLENLALCFLQNDPKNSLNASAEKENPLKLAVNRRCLRVFVMFMKIIAAYKDLRTLLTFSDGTTILDAASAPNCPETDAETIIKTVAENFRSLITQADGDDETPLDKAAEAGKLKLVELMVKYCPSLKYACLARRVTPLHRIRNGTYEQYQKLLQVKAIDEMKNVQDVNYETPLHKSIRSKDLPLTEALLTTHGIDLDLEDNYGKTAMDLLAEKAKRDHDWSKLCKRARIDPILKLTYAQRAEYFLKLREVLLVVATLLAAITFKAGFTLPGGLNSDSGEAILAKKTAFLVFLLADAYAMCCSMLVLFCLIWSLSCDRDKSITLIRRSMWILFHSLYGSLVTFMSGVFIVISRTSLWPTIIIIVMCSFIGLGAMNGEILCKLLDMFGVCDKLIDVLLGSASRRSQTSSPPNP